MSLKEHLRQDIANMSTVGETEKRDAVTEMGITEETVFLKSKNDSGEGSTLYLSPESAREMGRILTGLADLLNPLEVKPVMRKPLGMMSNDEQAPRYKTPSIGGDVIRKDC